MGYTTDFDGEAVLNKKLSDEHHNYLVKFSETRRMQRMEFFTAKLPDATRELAGLPVGTDGRYYVGGEEGKTKFSSDIVDYNCPPPGQPGVWCQWVPSDEGTAIVWDGGEKFYKYTEWMKYLIQHFLAPWGYVLNGKITWQGEDMSDRGVIVIVNNLVMERSVGELVDPVEVQQQDAAGSVDLRAALESILEFQSNPVRRGSIRRGAPVRSLAQPDWVATKDRIFDIAKKALGK